MRLVVALLALAGCSQRTEMLVRVFNDDVAIPATINRLHLSVSSLSMVRHEEDVDLCRADNTTPGCHTLPISILLIPGSDTLSEQVSIEIDSWGDGPDPVISDAGRFLFTRGTTLTMDFVLHSICAGTDCAKKGLACLADGHCGAPTVTTLMSLDQGASEADLAVPAGYDLSTPRRDLALPLPDLRGLDLAGCTPALCNSMTCAIDPCSGLSCPCPGTSICQLNGTCAGCGSAGESCCLNGCDNGLVCDTTSFTCGAAPPPPKDMACVSGLRPNGIGPGPLNLPCQ